MGIKVLDTFAGAGGFSLGFHMAGAETVGAIEIDRWASETFAFNNPDSKVIQADIKDLSDKDILDNFGSFSPDIVLGGPPCQGYSICNKNNGDPKDPRNSLFEEFIRVGRVLEPRVMIMENVPNLLKAQTKDGHKVVEIIRSELESLGYFVDYKILEATDFGVPQIRRRIVFVASRNRIDLPFPIPTHKVSGNEDIFSNDLRVCPSLWDAISDLSLIHI